MMRVNMVETLCGKVWHVSYFEVLVLLLSTSVSIWLLECLGPYVSALSWRSGLLNYYQSCLSGNLFSKHERTSPHEREHR